MTRSAHGCSARRPYPSPSGGQMHPYICEAAGDLERFGHLWMIGDAERDPVGAKQFEDRRHETPVVPDLDREAHTPRQHADETLEALLVETKVRLQLEEDRPQLVAEAECRADDKVDGLLLDGEPLEVGDVAATLDGKQEARWGLVTPRFKALPRRLPVEGVIELDGVEVLRVEGEVLSCRHLLRVEDLQPVWIRPARAADSDIACH